MDKRAPYPLLFLQNPQLLNQLLAFMAFDRVQVSFFRPGALLDGMSQCALPVEIQYPGESALSELDLSVTSSQPLGVPLQ